MQIIDVKMYYGVGLMQYLHSTPFKYTKKRIVLKSVHAIESIRNPNDEAPESHVSSGTYSRLTPRRLVGNCRIETLEEHENSTNDVGSRTHVEGGSFGVCFLWHESKSDVFMLEEGRQPVTGIPSGRPGNKHAER